MPLAAGNRHVQGIKHGRKWHKTRMKEGRQGLGDDGRWVILLITAMGCF